MILNSIVGNHGKSDTFDCYVRFFKTGAESNTPYDYLNNFLVSDGNGYPAVATCNVDDGTLTIPIQKILYSGSYNFLTYLGITNENSSGTAGLDAEKITIDGFTEISGVYDIGARNDINYTYPVTLTVSASNSVGGENSSAEFEANMVVTLIDLDYCGDATAADVVNGKTFTSSAGLKVTGSAKNIIAEFYLSNVYGCDPAIASTVEYYGSNGVEIEGYTYIDTSNSLIAHVLVKPTSDNNYAGTLEVYNYGDTSQNIDTINASNILSKTQVDAVVTTNTHPKLIQCFKSSVNSTPAVLNIPPTVDYDILCELYNSSNSHLGTSLYYFSKSSGKFVSRYSSGTYPTITLVTSTSEYINVKMSTSNGVSTTYYACITIVERTA